MAVTQYIGARYVPILADPAEWSSTKQYEPLTIVLHEGNSYTSRQFVPVGVDIDNSDFWVLTGNYNAQIEQYRSDVNRYSDDVDAYSELVTSYKTLYDAMIIVPENYGAIGDGVTDDSAAFNLMISDVESNGKNKVVYLRNTYLLDDTVNFGSGYTIVGNNATIKGHNGFTFNGNNICINGVQFKGDLTANIGETYALLFNSCNNVEVYNCDFEGYKTQIHAIKCNNVNVHNCLFSNSVYTPSTITGGYGLLEESCDTVNVYACRFVYGDYGRHGIYVSVYSENETVVPSKNINIFDCYFDRTHMHLINGAYYSDTTTCINIRAVYGCSVNNIFSEGGAGVVTTNPENERIYADISNIVSNDNVLIPIADGPAESRAVINCLKNSTYESVVNISNVVCNNKPNNFRIVNCGCTKCTIQNIEGVFRAIGVDASCIATIKDIHLTSNNGIEVIGSGTFKGRFYNIYSDASVVFPAVLEGAKIDVECYDSYAWAGIYLVGSSLRLPNKPHVPVMVAASTVSTNGVSISVVNGTGKIRGLNVISSQRSPLLVFCVDFFVSSTSDAEVVVNAYNIADGSSVASFNACITRG